MGLFNFRKKKEDNNKSHVQRYMDYLDSVFKQEPIFIQGEKKGEDALPGVTVMIYKNVPEEGFITGITYGLSLANHPEWKHGRPELCISVASSDESWATVAAYIANRLRGDCPFSYGQVINFGQQISEESDMDAFFIFAPSTLDKESYFNIDIGAEYKISIAGLYPIYSEELETFNKIGLEKFWHHPDFDNYAVNRNKIIVAE